MYDYEYCSNLCHCHCLRGCENDGTVVATVGRSWARAAEGGNTVDYPDLQKPHTERQIELLKRRMPFDEKPVTAAATRLDVYMQLKAKRKNTHILRFKALTETFKLPPRSVPDQDAHAIAELASLRRQRQHRANPAAAFN